MAEAAWSHVNVFKNLEDNLNLVIQQLRDGESVKTVKGKFDPDKYWNDLAIVFKALSMEGTKLSLAFTRPPFPSAKESEGMVNSVEKTVLQLVTVYYALPKTQGLTLRRFLRSAVTDLVSRVLELVSGLAKLDPRMEQRKQATGVVWEAADKFSSLPRDNCQAAQHTLEEANDLVADALSEVEELISSNGRWTDICGEEEEEESDNTGTWTDHEKEIVCGPLKGLIKTGSKVMGKAIGANKARGKCSSDDQVAQLDDLSDYSQRLSPAVDNLSCCMYAPLDLTAVKNNATALSEVISSLLTVLRNSHMTGEDDNKWMDFLTKANNHNMTTLLHLLDK